MDLKDTFKDIAAEVADLLATPFTYTKTGNVPYDHDQGLSYEGGKTKTGKTLDTCVLYADIRGSVAMAKNSTDNIMGRLYTAFVKSVIRAGRYHNGHTRNIIGDRVMIVFDSEDCFTNAVSCAISINHICERIISPKFKTLDFKCGVGVDYGKMKVLKVGVPRKGDAANHNRGLVWTGKPANLASRLTDMGNKTTEVGYFVVTKEPNITFHPYVDIINQLHTPRSQWENLSMNTSSNPQIVEISEEQFARYLSMIGKQLYHSLDKVLAFERKTRTITYKPILITKRVLDGLKDEKQNKSLYSEGRWIQQPAVKDVDVDVYGTGLLWDV